MSPLYLVREMEMIAKKASELFCPERKGGFFCAQKDTERIPFLVSQIGEPEENKRIKYFELSKEKAFRLYVLFGDMTSWQSRNELTGKWGGAIRAGKYIFSFSGFPELVDEAMMLVLGVRSRIINFEKAEKMAKISQNPYFRELFSSLPLCSAKIAA